MRRWCRASFVGPLMVVLSLAGTVGACGTVQSDVRARVSSELEAAGLVSVGIAEVSYRDVTLEGPAEFEAESIEIANASDVSTTVTYRVIEAQAAASDAAGPALGVHDLGRGDDGLRIQ
jgi:hypothetical protein